jgi:hypothetical protein
MWFSILILEPASRDIIIGWCPASIRRHTFKLCSFCSILKQGFGRKGQCPASRELKRTTSNDFLEICLWQVKLFLIIFWDSATPDPRASIHSKSTMSRFTTWAQLTYASLSPGYFQFCAYYLDACHRQSVDWGTSLDPPSDAKVLAAACPP